MDGPYAGESIAAVILMTGLLGGGAAWLSGRAIAAAWRPPWHAAVVAILLGAAARFFHFALFGGRLLSFTSAVCDTGFFLFVALLAWRATRARQMVRQYPWLYARAGPLGWRKLGRETSPDP